MNRLAAESSLYLRQHAENPVDWYPWGPEALALAKSADKPIFLSIGYSACHWCHVMAHESFEDDATAAVMNEHFVNVKVDREERPDLDQIYMTAHGLLNRGEGGGWPLSVWLTPDATPFYAGTYFPPREMYGRPSFRRVLLSIADAWTTKRDQIDGLGTTLAEHLQSMGHQEAPPGAELNELFLQRAGDALLRIYDPVHGGFGRAPKFPHAQELRLLLRCADRYGRSDLVTVVHHTLSTMARGGIYDQLGGGFARYSVDDRWLVPHFEKMLYDNAQLVDALVELHQRTGDDLARQIAGETLDWVRTEMTSPSGGFYSTLDADSEGEEGKFYVWQHDELDAFSQTVFGSTPAGNFEGHNILTRPRTDAEDAMRFGLSLSDFRQRLTETKKTLYGIRAKRIWPGRDEKILTSWNALMIGAFARAGAAFQVPEYLRAAERAAEFVLTRLRDSHGRLFRTCSESGQAKLAGYLEDYAFLAEALITLAESACQPRWLIPAIELTESMIRHFADVERGGFYATADDHESLIARTKDLHDGSIPSGNAVAAMVLLKLFPITGRINYRDLGEKTLQCYAALMDEQPMASGALLNAFDFHRGPVEELVIVGPRTETQQVAGTLLAAGLRNRLLVVHDPSDGAPAAELTLLHDRPLIDGQVTLYRCRNGVCETPFVGLAAIRAALGLGHDRV